MTQSVEQPTAALSETAEILEKLKIPYFLVGSFASGMHGEFRSTNDIDIVTKFDSSKLTPFFSAIETSYICDTVAFSKAVEEKSSYNIIHDQSFVKIDFFFKLAALENNEFDRTEAIPVPGTQQNVHVSTVEYNILAKLRWYKKSGEQLERQLRDVEAMIRVNREDIDRDYLDRWAKELQLEKHLAVVYEK